MPRRNPKPIGRRLAAKYRFLRKWRRAWDTKPDQMERARQRNVLKAHDHYRELNDNLRTHVSSWPATMTSPEFIKLMMDTVPLLGKGRTRKGYNWRSFRARLVRLGFCTFDPLTRKWTNTTATPLAL